jgi:DNA invertase Pin-like site-specific DNA recombinase
MSRDDKNGSRRRAAAYVRISTEHQQCSTGNQIRAIRESAKRRGLEIVEEYSDEDKTGFKP